MVLKAFVVLLIAVSYSVFIALCLDRQSMVTSDQLNQLWPIVYSEA